MKIKLKYYLGDKFIRKSDGKEYTVDSWKAVKRADGLVISYCFHAYLDDALDYHEYIPEDQIEKPYRSKFYYHYKIHDIHLECKDPHPHEVEVDETDYNGHKICIDDTIYDNILFSSCDDENDGYTADANMSFGEYSTVVGLEFKQAYCTKLINQPLKIGGIHTQVITRPIGPDDRLAGDFDRYKPIKYVFKNVSDKFINLYVSKLRRASYEKQEFLKDGDYMRKARQILKHMGILERVTEMVKAKKPPKKNTPAKKKKLQKEVNWEEIAKKLAEKAGVDIKSLM